VVDDAEAEDRVEFVLVKGQMLHAQKLEFRAAAEEFFALLAKFPAKFLIISFNSEGFISKAEFLKNLAQIGSVRTIEIRYPTYRASRNLSARELYVTEFLYVVQK